jgi:hypothetical protein
VWQWKTGPRSNCKLRRRTSGLRTLLLSALLQIDLWSWDWDRAYKIPLLFSSEHRYILSPFSCALVL